MHMQLLFMIINFNVGHIIAMQIISEKLLLHSMTAGNGQLCACVLANAPFANLIGRSQVLAVVTIRRRNAKFCAVS